LADGEGGANVTLRTDSSVDLGRSKPQVNDAVKRLEAVGVLKQVTVGRRNRAFEALEVIDAFAGLERQLATAARTCRRHRERCQRASTARTVVLDDGLDWP
jgi:hypothetical protein